MVVCEFVAVHMPKTKQQKQETIKNLTKELKNAKGAVFADYTGLKVNEMQELRAKLKETNSTYTASRRTLLKRALKDSGLDSVDIDALSGSLSVAASSEDEVTPARIIAEFARDHEALKIQGGILENKFIDILKVEELSHLLTKPELLAKVVGTINAPVAGFVNVLAGNLRGLVQALNAIKEQKA